MKRVLVALLLAASSITAFAQGHDPVFAQIEADEVAWKRYLEEQYVRHGLSRGDYEGQLQTLARNIENRRATRAAELAEIQRKRNVEERQTRAMEQIANQPPVVVQQQQASPQYQPSRAINCTTNRFGNTAYTSCY